MRGNIPTPMMDTNMTETGFGLHSAKLEPHDKDGQRHGGHYIVSPTLQKGVGVGDTNFVPPTLLLKEVLVNNGAFRCEALTV